MQGTHEQTNEIVIQKIDKVCQYTINLSSPVDLNGVIYIVASNGDILKQVESDQFKNEYNIGGQPQGIAFDKPGKNLFIADMTHQSLLLKQIDDKGGNEVHQELMKEFEGIPLNGPNSVICSSNFNCVYFTDSGPFGETNIENPNGSVYVIDLEEEMIKPLALNCLAFPSGLALSLDEKIIYVCETCKNRIIRFVLSSQGIYYFSIYVQFKGRFGPIALTMSQSEYLYAACFDFVSNCTYGMISVINPYGKIIYNLKLPDYPEINGLAFSKKNPDYLYFTENSGNQPQCLGFSVHLEKKVNEEEEIDKKIDKVLMSSNKSQMQ